jgi:hypothetical protein
MKTEYIKHKGFSLIEAIIATGILALGLAMIAMAFPVGVKLASIATERPVGVVAANEAFAKICLYGIRAFSDPNWAANSDSNPATTVDNTCTDYWPVCKTSLTLLQKNDQRCYPSLVPQPMERRYYWSSLVRRADSNTNEVQATVFVCRMLGMGSAYYTSAGTANGQWPVPVKVRVQMTAANEVQVMIPSPLVYTPSGAEYKFFTEGSMIVEDSLGSIYKVMEMKDLPPIDGVREILVLDKAFTTTVAPSYVWVVPPAIGSSRNPCIDISQRVLAF